MTDLQKAFRKESKNQQGILLSAAAAIIATFLPWAGFLGFSMNGWRGSGLLTVIGSVGLLALWLLPKLGVKLKLPVKNIQAQQILSVLVLAGPVTSLLQAGFSLAYLELGFYLALLSGAGAVFFTFKK